MVTRDEELRAIKLSLTMANEDRERMRSVIESFQKEDERRRREGTLCDGCRNQHLPTQQQTTAPVTPQVINVITNNFRGLMKRSKKDSYRVWQGKAVRIRRPERRQVESVVLESSSDEQEYRTPEQRQGGAMARTEQEAEPEDLIQLETDPEPELQ